MGTIVCSVGIRVINHAVALSWRSASGSDFGGNAISPICIPVSGRQIRSARIVLVVKAMAKYKGTLMREKKLAEMIESKIKEATDVCDGDRTSDECKVAWDEVEEISQAMADLRRKLNQHQDPLESYCQENPETDECRIYDD